MPDKRSRQKRVGDVLRQETRARLLDAAEQEFGAHGYAGTTVTRLAASAGVSVQTLYLAWGSKRGLLRGYMERALAGGVGSPDEAAARFEGLEPARLLITLADTFAEVTQRAATGWRLYSDAAAVDPEIAADWNELQMLRHQLFTRAIGRIPTAALRPGLTQQAAIDTAWAIASPETYDLLVRRLDYSLDRFHKWVADALFAAILPPSQHQHRPHD